jgi:hypothetical protein
MTEQPTVADLRQRIQTAYLELLNLLDTRVAMLPAERLYQEPAPGEWTMMENLAHVAEFMPYWADEFANLVASPGRNFGRTQQNERRLRGISEHAHDSLDQLRSRLPESYLHLDDILANVRDGDLQLTGHHVTYGERTLGWFINEFLITHLEAHNRQLLETMQPV